MRWLIFLISGFIFSQQLRAQSTFKEKLANLKIIKIDSGVIMTIDEPPIFTSAIPTKVIVYALPNGNSTAQTVGKKMAQGDDWHFDIQHIGAQLAFIRNLDKTNNYVVIYLENELKSWPAWRKKYPNADEKIGDIVSDLMVRYKDFQPKITLSCHSGGGSFIFGYLNSQNEIPKYIERIGFLDATYGYETEKHTAKLKTWLNTKNKFLQIISYNDSVVVFNGKPLVSPTGGTWYRSKLMANDLKKDFKLKYSDFPDRLKWNNNKHSIDFTLIKNPEAKIYHTVLVEKNGFIQLIFNGTNLENKNYKFWEDRAYSNFILP